MIGREILNYIIESKIGEGGMATVYKARHKTLQNTYRAIKVLHPAMAADPGIKAKFINEAQTLAKLNHPALVKVFDYYEQGHELFLIMEFVPGTQLDYMLKNVTGPLPELRVKKLFAAVLDGIEYAHSMGIIHRDIKPSNIIITPQDLPVIIDFGIVKVIEGEGGAGATKTGTKIGTAMYMSPEQILARGVDKRTDIYALGITLFNMVTGRAPFDSATLSDFEIQQKMVSEPLPRAKVFYPAVSEHIQAVIDKATAKKKEDRFQGCAGFKAALLDDQYKPAAESHHIFHFSADKAKIKKGGNAILRWEVTGVESCVITGLGSTKNLKSSVSVSPTTSTTYILKAGGEEKALYVEVAKPAISGGTIAAIIIGALLVIWIVYGVNKSGNDSTSNTTTTDTAMTTVPPVDTTPSDNSQSTNTTDTKKEYASADTPATMYTDKPGDAGVTTITDDDRHAVNALVGRHTRAFTGYISPTQLSELTSDYSYPVRQYYNNSYSDYSWVSKANDNYYNKTIRDSYWNIDTDKSTFTKNTDGTFDIELYGDYYYHYQMDNTKHDPNAQYHLYLHNRYKLNSSYKIIEEYEVSRRDAS